MAAALPCYDDWIVLRGLPAVAERLIAAIPEARRGWWTQIIVHHEPDRRNSIAIRFRRDPAWVDLPIGEALLEET